MNLRAASIIAIVMLGLFGCGKLRSKSDPSISATPTDTPVNTAAAATDTATATTEPSGTPPEPPPSVAQLAEPVPTAPPTPPPPAGYKVGDRVKVVWGGKLWPATILTNPSPGRYRVHYDGWSSSWDETVTSDRIRGTVGSAAPPPTNTVATAPPTGGYKTGDGVMVLWGGKVWPARIIGTPGGDRYRVHYDGWSSSWDETVHVSRIKGRR